MKPWVPVLLLVLCSSSAADEVTLKDGRKLVGIFREDPDQPERIEVELAEGTVRLKRSDVLAVNPGYTPLHEYYERWQKIREIADIEDLVLLWGFARKHGLVKPQRGLMEAVLRLDPDHEGARRFLGYERFQGRWMTQTEVFEAKGLVKFEGRWMTTAERALKVSESLDRAQKKLEASIQREERRAGRRTMVEYPDWPGIIETPYGVYHRPNWFWPYYYRPHRVLPRPYDGWGRGRDIVPTLDVLDLIDVFGGGLIP